MSPEPQFTVELFRQIYSDARSCDGVLMAWAALEIRAPAKAMDAAKPRRAG